MSKLQDRLKLVTGTAVIAGEESELAVKGFFSSMPKWQKAVFFVCLVLIIPGYFGTYYGSRAVYASRHKSDLLTAHAAFAQAKPIGATSVNIIKVAPTQYAAYFQITNNNLDLAAPDVPYSIDFFNTAGEKLYTATGNFFLLPDQKKYIIIPRIDNREEIVSGKLSITTVKWQKRLDIPQVDFKTPTPDVYNDTSGINQLVAEGSVVNNSPYNIQNIQITFLLYDKSGNVIGVNLRTESNIAPFGRRAYKQTWPAISADSVSKVEVSVDVNSLDSSNLNYTPTDNTPAANNPDLTQ